MNTLQTTLRWLLISALCAGCVGQAPLAIPTSSPSMIEIYERHAISTAPRDGRPVQDGDAAGDVRTPIVESKPTQHPVIHVYVFPHVSRSDGLSVPGYWTSLRLAERHEPQPASVTE